MPNINGSNFQIIIPEANVSNTNTNNYNTGKRMELWRSTHCFALDLKFYFAQHQLLKETSSCNNN